MPHLLVAGTTGSGKSVAVNAMILSLLYKASASDVRVIMIDPKMLELSVYEGIPHLLAPVVTDMKHASNALQWCVVEMDRRYRLMSALGVRNIGGYNRKVRAAADEGEPLKDPLFVPNGGEGRQPALEKLPYIVVIVDELADMMMVTGKKVEELIARLAQKARAAGIHLILATQRPSVDVITGLIKANIPSRIAFQVSSKVDSRTILDQMGAEHLLGHGDMLYLGPGVSTPNRVHGAFVADHEVHKVVKSLKRAGRPSRISKGSSTARRSTDGDGRRRRLRAALGSADAGAEADPLYDQAVRIVTETRRASISGVQRRLKIGYNRAARMLEEMELAGVVGPLQSNGKPRGPRASAARAIDRAAGAANAPRSGQSRCAAICAIESKDASRRSRERGRSRSRFRWGTHSISSGLSRKHRTGSRWNLFHALRGPETMRSMPFLDSDALVGAGLLSTSPPVPLLSRTRRARLNAYLSGLDNVSSRFEQRLFDERHNLIEQANGTGAHRSPGTLPLRLHGPAAAHRRRRREGLDP